MKNFDSITRDHLIARCGQRYRLDDTFSVDNEDTAIVYGQKVEVVPHWKELKSLNATYVILGIPEDIGVRANMGRPGAVDAWDEFLNIFLNFQHSIRNDATRFAIAGSIHLADLMNKTALLDAGIHKDRISMSRMVEEIDFRVSEAISTIIKHDKIPIAIGGGHNNCYPIIKSFEKIDVINIDAHTDLRVANGRHSGNGFSHALKNGFLNQYFMIGLQTNYLSQPMIDIIDGNENIAYGSFLESVDVQITRAVNHIDPANYGLEIDMDVVRDFPSSAQSPVGYSFKELREMIISIIEQSGNKPKYIHICEAAPKYGYKNQVGKALATLVNDIK